MDTASVSICWCNNHVFKSMDPIIRYSVTPVCKSREPKTYGISVSETVNATCEVEADPQEVSYRWSLDSPLGTMVLSNWSSAPHLGSLNYSPLTGNGYGTLLCWGRNSMGTQKEPCLVNIVMAGEKSEIFEKLFSFHGFG
ncbi:UNVERIFIED_CONTAM: hypothetical protein NCL1_41588 [Trichonephila clavipes]